jgi:pimeloyl-ACP methyl ester carboxylesterase
MAGPFGEPFEHATIVLARGRERKAAASGAGGWDQSFGYPFVVEVIAGIELPDSRWIDAGGRTHYRRWEGPPEGGTIVCVHGLGGSLLNWALVAPGLARHGTVVALDLAGFGLSPPDGRGTDVASNRRLLDQFIRAVGELPVTLVGNSMGGQISLFQAALAPETVRSLVLVDAAFPRARTVRAQPSPKVAALFAVYASRRLGVRFWDARVRRLGPEGLVRESLRISAADPSTIDPRLVAASVESARRRMELDYASKAFIDAARSIFRAQVAPGRYRELVRSVTQPALVLHGARDQLVPLAAAREATAEHPNWTLEVFPDLGHIPMMEAPARWLETVEPWLGDHRPSKRDAAVK